MDKKIIIPVIGCFLLILVAVISSKYTNTNHEEKSLKEDTTSLLTSTVLKISDDQVTLQDEKNVIYTFLGLDTQTLAVGDSLEIEYKGNLDKAKTIQNNEIVGYKIVDTANNLPNAWKDNGIFSAFYDMAYRKLKDLSLDEKIGQILLARVPSANAVDDLKKYKFGGYLLYERNFQDKTKDEVKTLINNFQKNSSVPLLIAVDEEGGEVSRLSSNKNLVDTPFKSPRDLYLENGLTSIKADTIRKSQVLGELGINLNLAPDVDVSTSPSDYIYKRTLGEDATKTAEYAKMVITTSRDYKVSYTLKHFPGYGNNTDTHEDKSVDARDLDTIKKNDLLPFEAGIAAKAEAIMVSHNTVNALDDKNPASLSIPVHNLLREDLNFTGIVMTDDLSMGAITKNYQDNKIINAILAGNDLLIVTDYKEAVSEIKTALNNKTLTEDLLNKLVFKVLAWKYYKGLMIPNQK